MKKIVYVIITIVLVIVSAIITWTLTKSDNDNYLGKVMIFGNKIELNNGNVFQFSLKDVEVVSNTTIEGNGCLSPVDIDNDDIEIIATGYDKDTNSLEFYLRNKQNETNYSNSENFGTYGVYDYYIEIHDIDKSKVENAGYCFSQYNVDQD